jgi:hypothetical protein
VQIKQSVDQQKYDLEVRENRLVEIEPLIPSVKQLQGYGISFELILPYMQTIEDKAVAENIDIKTAVYGLAEELREYRQFGVERAKQELGVLNAFTAQKQQATLMNLAYNGVRESEIIDLINIARWSKQYDAGTGQGNGSGNHNNSAGNHNGGKAFKLDDKLNL